MEKRLGKGLGSLLGGAGAAETKSMPPTKVSDQPATTTSPGAVEIALEQIRENHAQPRVEFDPAAIDELAASISNHGILQPIVVRSLGHQRFELIAGERRLRAAKKVGLAAIPALVRNDVQDREMLELALVENVQRQSLNPIEKAQAFKDMADTLGIGQEQVADKVGLRRSTVANHLRILTLPQEAQEAIRQGLISMGHAKALVGLAKKEVLGHLETIVREGLSVRDIEKAVRKNAGGQETKAASESKDSPKAPWAADLESRMREFLGTKVSIKNGEGYKGQIVIDYFNRGDLDRLIEKLAPQTEV